MSDDFDAYQEMQTYDEFVPEELFSEFLARMPQVCVDIVVETDDGILLAKRTEYPQVWFWPGSRLYKGEQLENAAHRIAEEELGIEVDILDQLGPYAHFWERSAVEGSPTRHTVNAVFHVEPAYSEFTIQLDEQHSEYTFITENDPDFHEYIQLYLDDNDLV